MSKLRLDNTQVYEIQVQGRVSAAHADWFDGMNITVTEDAEGVPTATLYGSVADQAALHGILRKLYTLGLPLIAVRHIPR
ncbi:MAG: hypothetical protein ACP5HM_16630 [Anaerolineae bacterium]|jgi:hypothetical protein